jgi:hypothetical protein
MTAIVALLRFPETKIPSRLQEIVGVAAYLWVIRLYNRHRAARPT